MVNIQDCYSGRMIKHIDGIEYAVLDTSRLDFSHSAYGKKTGLTYARIAKPGEKIITQPATVQESFYAAQGGEVVFINRLPNGVSDEYVPRNVEGHAGLTEVPKSKYQLLAGDIHSSEGATYRPISLPSRILHEVIERPTCIENVWGKGNHQFLGKGATLKLTGSRVTGIAKIAFDATWSVTDALGRLAGKNVSIAFARL